MISFAAAFSIFAAWAFAALTGLAVYFRSWESAGVTTALGFAFYCIARVMLAAGGEPMNTNDTLTLTALVIILFLVWAATTALKHLSPTFLALAAITAAALMFWGSLAYMLILS